ncbi:hypothetical protein [Streptomyces sp. Ncost-T10-10d]|uniref:hypothetical protein n=1 Tax=Streptomyces sp. Ncost-T10-10d TaxID=1839774 RepID=UPI00081D451B|nr:hypothetical protein [Streptomyces sp. Ncost-T10-10d]SCF56939.1 hypothetical protein GA0115254_103711 [Streptomyces sp. Ncost-T10-10d]
MDAGLAGLIGALGGGLIGAAGASIAALIGFRGARYQVDRQTAATHEQWLRQIRRDLYVKFIADCRTCCNQMRDAVNDAGEVDTAGVQRWAEAAAAVTEAYRSMELEAPDPLVRLAERLRTMSGPDSSVREAARTGTTLSHQDNLRAEQQLITYYELVRLFVVACRESLQGEQPPDSFVPVTL